MQVMRRTYKLRTDEHPQSGSNLGLQHCRQQLYRCVTVLPLCVAGVCVYNIDVNIQISLVTSRTTCVTYADFYELLLIDGFLTAVGCYVCCRACHHRGLSTPI